MSLVDVIGGERFEREAPIPCPMCRQWREARMIDARYGMKASVAECEACRLAYQTPRPSDEASQAYMNTRWRAGDRYVADAAKKLKQAGFKARMVRRMAPKARSLLDFGAGSGAFVAASRRARFDALGLERSASARARAREFYGVELLERLPHNTRHDVITLWDVIEHLREPVGLLRFLRQRLTPGGLLVVETGNYESWKRLSRGDRWGLYLLDHHFYFTPTSLEAMLARAGFRDFALRDGGHAGPAEQASDEDRAAHAEAMRRWPGHGDISVMIATARG